MADREPTYLIWLSAADAALVLGTLDAMLERVTNPRLTGELDRLVHLIASQIGVSAADVAEMRRQAGGVT